MIKGLRPALAPAGCIKIGGLGKPLLKNASKGKPKDKLGPSDYWRPPLKFDNFVVTKTSRNDAGDLAPDDAVMAALPKEKDGRCREIPIVIHSDDIDEVFPTSYALYAGRKLACTGNGEKAMRYDFDKQTRQRLETKREVPCVCPYYTDEGTCKTHGTLHCSLSIPGLAVAGAVYRWRTTSIISIQRMVGSLQQILATAGTLRNVPLVLRLEPVVVSPEGKTTTVYVAHVELRARDLVEVQSRALEAARIRNELGGATSVPYRALISAPASDTETPEEAADVYEEFHQSLEEGEPEQEPARAATQSVKDIATGQAGNGKPAAPTPAAEPAKPKGDGKSKEQREAEFRAKNAKKAEPAKREAAADVDYGAPDDVAF